MPSKYDATVLVVNVDAVAFSQQWVRAWNAHDVEAVLRHFHENVVSTSPVAAKLVPETAGVIRGKPELRRYWTVALQSIPDLRFARSRQSPFHLVRSSLTGL